MQRAYAQILRIPFVRFVLSGISGAAVYYGVFLIFRHLDVHYQIAATIAAVCSIALNFYALSVWAFEDSNKDARKKQVGYFGVKKVAFYLLNILTLFVLVEKFHLIPEVAQLVAITGLGCFSFLILRRIFAP